MTWLAKQGPRIETLDSAFSSAIAMRIGILLASSPESSGEKKVRTFN